jgi:probable non-F420 flavinoid oxidoreductase
MNPTEKRLLLGFHASHEQFAPSHLIKLSQQAEAAGFDLISSSDHFCPWSEKQGESGFAYAWLGASMQATTLPHMVVTAPGQRYHPAIVAQAAATLAEMFPDRFALIVGTGQYVNEHITGERWPKKEERNARLLECATVIRALWAGENVNYKGLVTVENAKLYTRPQNPPLLIGAAITATTAKWIGSWADGLITISQPKEQLQAVIDAFRAGGGEGKPIFLKVQLSYAATEKAARDGAFDQWKNNIFTSNILADFSVVSQFDEVSQFVRPEDLDDFVHISADINQHIDWIEQYREMGFSRITLHNVNREQEAFIEAFGSKVLPEIKGSNAASAG